VEAVNMLLDITGIRQKEKALRESEERYKQIAEDLEKRVQERTGDLKKANLSLQSINSELEQFVFIASHDMQEPLRKIKNFAFRLESRAADALDDVARSYLGKIKNSSERMTDLIKGILDYSRLDREGQQYEQTDLNDVLAISLNDFELNIEEKKALIHAGRLPQVKAIPMQMNQLFHNLISNSLKFCKADAPCELTITSRMLPAEEAAMHTLSNQLSYYEIIFKDNGIGFNDQYAESVFKIFERLNARSHYEGTGIGLALCRKIVSGHHGKIFAESKINEGTAVHVILPLTFG
jgi:light-regulated signal transduction histidine kinase (bacteriophytochrome)